MKTRMEKYQDLRNRLEKEEREHRQIETAKAWNDMFGNPMGEIENLLEIINVKKRRN